jgi:hypothetical protein
MPDTKPIDLLDLARMAQLFTDEFGRGGSVIMPHEDLLSLTEGLQAFRREIVLERLHAYQQCCRASGIDDKRQHEAKRNALEQVLTRLDALVRVDPTP